MSRPPSFRTFTLLAALAALGGCKAAAANINGRIVALREGQTVPVGDAQVRIWPSEPGKRPEKFEAEAIQNLRGISTTRPSGAFQIATLSSPSTSTEYPLLKGYVYTIEVEVPGYYVTSSTFEYAGGNQYVEMKIEEKVADVLDTTGVIKENERELSRGSVQRGN
jgi:hypothetical protein